MKNLAFGESNVRAKEENSKYGNSPENETCE